MLKIEKDYKKEYGDIPSNALSRVDYLLNKINLKRQKKSVLDEIKRISNIK